MGFSSRRRRTIRVENFGLFSTPRSINALAASSADLQTVRLFIDYAAGVTARENFFHQARNNEISRGYAKRPFRLCLRDESLRDATLISGSAFGMRSFSVLRLERTKYIDFSFSTICTESFFSSATFHPRDGHDV